MESYIICNCCGKTLPLIKFPYKPDGTRRKICYSCTNIKKAIKYREISGTKKQYTPRTNKMIPLEGEEWRKLLYKDKLFYVSSIGRVGYERADGEIYLYATYHDEHGYLHIKKHKGFSGAIHRLVVSAFIGEIPNGMEVNHKNGIKDDNLVSNLEIVTPKENIRHSIEVLGHKHLGLLGKTGSDNKLSKPILCFDKFGNFCKRYDGLRDAARELNVKASSICAALKGRRPSCKGFIWKYE